MRQLLPHMQIISSRHHLPSLSPQFRWFWSSSPYPIGEEVDINDFNPNQIDNSQSIRLVRIDSAAFELLWSPLESLDFVDEVAGGTNPWQGDRYADLAQLLPQLLIIRIK